MEVAALGRNQHRRGPAEHVGGALRRHKIHTRFDYEVPVGRCIDYLLKRDDVDASRIAVSGSSMGGYYAARAGSKEHRLAACISHGAIWDIHERWKTRDDNHGLAGAEDFRDQAAAEIAAEHHHDPEFNLPVGLLRSLRNDDVVVRADDGRGCLHEDDRFPRLHTMGSDGAYYTQREVRAIVAYARDRGIRVVPEFDMPGHATSWLVSHPEIGSAPGPYKIERLPGIFDPTLDPTFYRITDEDLETLPSLIIGGPIAERTSNAREAAEELRRILASLGIRINSISDVTPVPHNGCRPPKRRRM